MIAPKRLLPWLLASLTLPASQLIFSGCATVTQGPTERVRVASNPPHATVFLNGKSVGQTPTMIVLGRFRAPRLRLELPGYEPFDLHLEKQLTYNVLGNFWLFYTPIVIDAATGSIFEFKAIADSRQGDLVTQPWTREEWTACERGTLFVGVELDPKSVGRKIGQMKRKEG
jgi:hypothetical protein